MAAVSAINGRPIITAPKVQEELHQCKWLECRTVFDTAEDLYDHITTLHIGRKSAGTLSLECKWQGCTSKASKRDHLTSHICSKAFKRPQDLKKHEKIHTEEHHQNHKHSKAVTVPSSSPNSAPKSSSSPDSQDGVQTLPPTSMPFPAGFYNFGFNPFAMMNGQGQPTLDLAALVAQQQQMNAQVSAGYSMPLGLQGVPGMQGFPVFSQQMATNPQQAMQMIAAGMMPFPMSYAPFQPGQPAMTPQQQQHQPMPQQYRPQVPQPPAQVTPQPVAQNGYSLPPNQPQSLYPSLPASYSSVYPQLGSQPVPAPTGSPASITNLPTQNRVKVEDTPSPAASHVSHYSNHLSQHSTSTSPRVPALSPPSMSSPEADTDSEFNRRSFSSNAVASKKRGLEEAANSFLEGLKKGRFQDEDAVAQLDQIGNYFVTPDLMLARPHSPHQVDSDSPVASDFSSQAEVNKINELLLSLGQTIEHDSTSSLDSYTPLDSSISSHMPQYSSHLPSYSSSLYPSLSTATTPSARSYAPFDDHFRVAHKAVAPPSIVNDQKLSSYTSIGRLTRAAPLSSERDSMEVDAPAGKAYSSSLRSTSNNDNADQSVKLAPIQSQHGDDAAPPRLPPISSITQPSPRQAPSSGITLPSIRDMMARAPGSSASTSSTSLYPSFPTSSSRSTADLVSRPVSSGGVERLAHRVHKLDFRHREASVGEETGSSTSSSTSPSNTPTNGSSTVPSIVEEADESSSDDETLDGTTDHPSLKKKSRMSSPARTMFAKEELDQSDIVKQRRLAIIRSLIILVNSQYRSKVAMDTVNKQQQSTTATSRSSHQLRESINVDDEEEDELEDDEVDELEEDDDDDMTPPAVSTRAV
ncbi:hypothetical protein OIO90_001166 [Microbotryomycetes sp. JL221]|nr:hypothetical protein OIO90_001166 [Microbotryomycetes sp. JL221]